MQNYCFTTYLPNVSANFFTLFYAFYVKSLICKEVVRHLFEGGGEAASKLYLIIVKCARIGFSLNRRWALALRSLFVDVHLLRFTPFHQ